VNNIFLGYCIKFGLLYKRYIKANKGGGVIDKYKEILEVIAKILKIFAILLNIIF